jgi:sulfite reductase (ferredoxin)
MCCHFLFHTLERGVRRNKAACLERVLVMGRFSFAKLPSQEPAVRIGDAWEYEAGLAAFRAGELAEDAWTGFRVRFGIYGQRQKGVQMVRTKLPGGLLSPDKLKAFAEASRRFAGGAAVHLTTRQDAQFYFVPTERTPEMLGFLAEHGITTREAGGNTFRNVTSCALSGVCPHEHVDAAEVAERLSTSWLRQPLAQRMPRKVKVAVSGCAADCGRTAIDDLGFIAVEQGGRKGFRVFAGGGLGARPVQAVEVLSFVSEEDLPRVMEAAARLHQGLSNRHNKNASRLKFLLLRFGPEEFRRRFTAEFERLRDLSQRPWVPLSWRDAAPDASLRSPRGIIAQPNGQLTLVIEPVHGDFTPDQLDGLAELAQSLGLKELRATRDQTLLLINVPVAKETEILEAIKSLGLPVRQEEGLPRVVACPGSASCGIGITNSHALGAAIRHKLDEEKAKAPISVHVSGCHNSCGLHHVGDFGLHGLAKKAEGGFIPHYQIHFGSGGNQVGKSGPVVPARQAAEAVSRLRQAYLAERFIDDAPASWAERKGEEGIEALLGDLLLAASDEGAFIDIGDERAFTPPAQKHGECAAPIVPDGVLSDLAEDGLLGFDRAVAAAKHDLAWEFAEVALYRSAQRLLAKRGQPVEDVINPASVAVGLYQAHAADADLLALFEAVKAAKENSDSDFLRAALVDWLEAVDAILAGRSIAKKGEPIRLHPPIEVVERRFGKLEGEDLLTALVAAYPGKVAISSSFGAESALLLDIAAKVDPSLPVLTLDTGHLFPESREYARELTKHLGLKDVRVLRPDEERVAKLDPQGTLWGACADCCCELRKVEPLAAAASEFAILVDGRKRYHGGARVGLSLFEVDGQTIKVSPLAHWDEKRIAEEFEQRRLPRHPLSLQGYASIGCAPCTQPVGEGQGVREGRWAGSGKTECGIHKAKRAEIA